MDIVTAILCILLGFLAILLGGGILFQTLQDKIPEKEEECEEEIIWIEANQKKE